MQNDVLQASFLTAVGLAELDEAFNVLGMPFFVETSEEEAAIEKKLTPMLEQRLQAKGLHLLGWGTARMGAAVLEEAAAHAGRREEREALRLEGRRQDGSAGTSSNGFHPVALLPADIPTQLKLSTGLIDAAPNPPYLALSLQIFRDAKYMLDVHVAPLVAGLIVTNTAWNRVSLDDRAKLTAAAQALEQRVRTEAPIAGCRVDQADAGARPPGHHARSESGSGVPRCCDRS